MRKCVEERKCNLGLSQPFDADANVPMGLQARRVRIYDFHASYYTVMKAETEGDRPVTVMYMLYLHNLSR